MTNQELEDFNNGLYLDFNDRFSSTQIDGTNLLSNIFSKMSANCVWITTSRCSYGNVNHMGGYQNGSPCPGYESEMESFCPISGGQDNTNNGSDNGNSGGEDGDIGNGETGVHSTNNYDNVTTFTYTEQPWEEILECNNSIVGIDGAVEWLQNNKGKAGQINDYLEGNSCSQESKDFVEEAIEILIENPELEFEDLIQIANQMDNPCQAKVLLSALFINSPFAVTFKNELVTPTDWHINFQDINVGEGTPQMEVGTLGRVLASTATVGSNNFVIMEFNNSHLSQSTNLGYVITLYHEMLHAYIVKLYYTGELLNTFPQYNDLDTAFDNLLEDPLNVTLGEIHEEEMHNIYIDFIDKLANCLVQYCIKKNINGVNLEYARKLIWGSLLETDVSNNNQTQTQQDEANILINHENLNHENDAKGPKTCN